MLFKYPFLILYFVMIVMGVGVYMLTENDLHDSKLAYIFASGYVAIFLGIAFSHALFMPNKRMCKNKKMISGPVSCQFTSLLFISGLVIASLTILFYLINGAPIFAADPYTARLKIGTAMFSNLILRASTFTLPFISMALFVAYVNTRNRKVLHYCVVLLTFSLIFRVLAGNKGGALELVLLTFVFLSFYRSIKLSYIGIALSLSLFIAVFVNTLHSGSGFSDSLGMVVERVFVGSVMGAHILTDEYLSYGYAVSSLLNFGTSLLEWKFGEQEASFTLTLTLPAYIYALLGLEGMFVVHFLFGVFFYYLNKAVYRHARSPWLAPLFVMSLFYLVFIFVRGSFLDMLLWQYFSIFMSYGFVALLYRLTTKRKMTSFSNAVAEK